MSVRDLARALAPDEPGSPTLRLRQGVVTAISAGTVSVTLGGASTAIAGVRYLGSYPPTVGDAVWLLANGPDLIALGRLAGSGTGEPRVVARRSTAYSVNNATDTAVPFEAATYNVGGMWAASPNPSRLTVTVPGVYLAVGNARWNTSASTAERYLSIAKNATSGTRHGHSGVAPSGGFVSLSASGLFSMAAGDYLEMWVFQSTGAALTLLPDFTWGTSLAAVLVAPN